MKSKTLSKPMFIPIRPRNLLPAAFALALSWSSGYVRADAAGQALLVTELTQFQSQEGLAHPKTLLTASDSDLARAVYAVIVQNANPEGVAADIASSALESSLNTRNEPAVRTDLNTVAPRILNAALLAVSQSGTPYTSADVTNVLAAVLSVDQSTNTARLELSAAGIAAVTGEALLDANDPAEGASIASTALSVAVPTQSVAALEAFVTNSLKHVGTNTGAVASFINGILVQDATLFTPSEATAFATTLAVREAAHPAVVGAIVAGVAESLTSDTAIEGFVSAAIGNARLAADVSAIVAQTGVLLSPATSETTYASALLPAVHTPKLEAAVLSGALQAAASRSLASSGDPTAGEPTADILALVPAVSEANALFAGEVAAGNGATNTAGDSRAAEVAQFFLNNATTGDTALQTAIGESVIKAIAAATPAAAQQVAFDVATTEGVTSNVSAAETLAGQLAKSTTVLSAAGSAVAGVASATGLGGGASSSNEVLISEAAIKKDSRAALNIAQSVSALYGGTQTVAGLFDNSPANLTQAVIAEIDSYAKSLAPGSSIVVTPGAGPISVAPAEAAGVAVTLGYAVDGSGTNAAANIALDMLNASTKVAPQALAIAKAVANAADYQETSAIATKVAGFLAGEKKLSSEVTLASSLAKIIETKSGVSYDSRVTELGELAASIVGQAIGQSTKSTATAAANVKAEATLIGAIGTAVINSLSKTLYPNVTGVNGIPADISDAIGYVTGSIVQSIAYQASVNGSLNQAEIETLLATGTSGTGSPLLAILLKTAGRNIVYQGDIKTAFSSVDGAFGTQSNNILPGASKIGTGGVLSTVTTLTGTYSIGSVVFPESTVVSI